jgi:uncharacterized cupin superfamily protein
MGIQIIAQSATAPVLQDIGKAAIPLSEPACALRGLEVTMAERPGCETGLWECSPGKFQRQVEQGEVMHILAGVGSFTPEVGEVVHFKAGDTLFFSPQTRGVWEIVETVRKLYVMV